MSLFVRSYHWFDSNCCINSHSFSHLHYLRIDQIVDRFINFKRSPWSRKDFGQSNISRSRHNFCNCNSIFRMERIQKTRFFISNCILCIQRNWNNYWINYSINCVQYSKFYRISFQFLHNTCINFVFKRNQETTWYKCKPCLLSGCIANNEQIGFNTLERLQTVPLRIHNCIRYI